jgi:E3 ubiquitin-protein ligase BRE1
VTNIQQDFSSFAGCEHMFYFHLFQGEEGDREVDKDRQLTSPPIKKEKDIKREKDVKKEIKTEKDHREQHRAKDAKGAESELVRDLKAQLK